MGRITTANSSLLFYPAYQYQETTVEVTINGGIFAAKYKQDKSQGWKALFTQSKNSTANEQDSNAKNTENEHQTHLPDLSLGQALHCVKGELLEKQTQPPQHFTDATLLGAMTGISRFVKDAKIRQILKETDGLGTEATRAGIIELLFKRNFLQRQGKQIRATEVGLGLINSLPDSVTTPDMTAMWESNLESISRKELKYLAFMQPMTESLQMLISTAKQQLPTALQGVKGKPFIKKKNYKSKKRT